MALAIVVGGLKRAGKSEHEVDADTSPQPARNVVDRALENRCLVGLIEANIGDGQVCPRISVIELEL